MSLAADVAPQQADSEAIVRRREFVTLLGGAHISEFFGQS
jgi:hypothetical protein